MKLSNQILMEEVHSEFLQKDEVESQEKPRANASFGILSPSRFHREQ